MRVYGYYTSTSFYFSAIDILIAVLIVFFILLYGLLKNDRSINGDSIYKYYFRGLIAKILGSITFALVYGLYYRGGDTVAYWYGAESLKNLFYDDPALYFTEIFSAPTHENFFNHFDSIRGYPPEWIYRSARHYFVCKIISPLIILIPNSFLGSTIALGFISYHGIWKLFTTMSYHFKHVQKYLVFSILFLPSTLFWCSGIMKDTIVLTGVCWIVHETDLFLRKDLKRNYFRFVPRLVIWTSLIFACKPYVIIALIPSWLVWMNYATISNIRNKIFKYYLLPIVGIGSFILAFQLYSTSTQESEFSPDYLLDQAIVVRNDFSTNNTYGTNRFQAENVEKSGTGVIAEAPLAIINGLFRPYIWEARSPFVFLSAAENLFILLYVIYAIFKLKISGIIKLIRGHPLLLFSIIFTVVLAFIVGFTSMVFGALVRFRTPFLPFFVSLIIVTVGRIRLLKVVTNYSNSQLNI